MTASSLSKKTATTTTAEVSTFQANQKEPINVCNTGYNTSGSVMRRRVEQGQPNQTLTLFAPVGRAEDLTKVQLILCKEIKAELQTVKETIANIPFEALQKDVSEATTNYENRMCTLEKGYNELKELIIHRTTHHVVTEPSKLTQWHPLTMVLKHSPWPNMRLMLNQVAADNITDLFPTDWQPRPTVSSVQEKHYKVLTEVMTDMFLQYGLLTEADIIEMDNYQDFLEVLHHHTFMGNVPTTQLTHFTMLMTYMSFCRFSHYTKYMKNRDAVLLQSAVWISLVVMTFKTTFSMKGSHHSINPYFKNLPTMVRRNLHVITIRYME